MITANELSGGLSDQQASGLAQSLGIDTPTATSAISSESVPQTASVQASSVDDHDHEDEDSTIVLEEEYAEEERVLTEAALEATDAVWTPISQFFVGVAADNIVPATSTLYRYGLGISIVSTGLGLLGYRRGFYQSPSRYYPSSRFVWSTAILGGAIAGATYWATRAFRTKTTSNNGSGSSSSPHTPK